MPRANSLGGRLNEMGARGGGRDGAAHEEDGGEAEVARSIELGYVAEKLVGTFAHVRESLRLGGGSSQIGRLLSGRGNRGSSRCGIIDDFLRISELGLDRSCRAGTGAHLFVPLLLGSVL